jgi:hypothetical protein
MNNGGGRYSERERESRSGGWKKIMKKNSNKGLTTGIGYSGPAALRRGQCDMYA